MSAGPAQLCIKRKRDERGPDRLILESPAAKRSLTDGKAQEISALRYVRVDIDMGGVGNEVGGRKETDEGVRPRLVGVEGGGERRRVFHLSRRGNTISRSRVARKGQETGREGVGTGAGQATSIATFEERKAGEARTRAEPTTGAQDLEDEGPAPAPLKRPSRRTAIPITRTSPSKNKLETPESRKNAETLAAAIHALGFEDLESPKQKLTSLPKFGTRRRDLHPQLPKPAAAPEPRILNADDKDDNDRMAVDPETDYVYDTYILSPPPPSTLSHPHTPDQSAGHDDENIGYLIITDADQPLWDSYLEGSSDSEENDSNDDADSNAEDYYGADYPEDELASDDEYDRGAYGFRRRGAGGSDDESWDGETGEFGGDEDGGKGEEFWKREGWEGFAGAEGKGEEEE
ncbi:hypothetical protein LTR62_002793 [Meristemomyces frigidus]|uniref:Transcription factor Iwr1 domain-containing protein n=1 Tax=Meristemomyces frigidus TaxID=1508187 RepID=A0AAN7YU70_9PEZI|nr:hypothetical protein LTR62_002793 [Meristemomyces frigidus]